MDRFEEAVLEYVSSNPDILLKSQFKIAYDKTSGTGGSLPDFLAINFAEECAYVIEVTTAWNIQSITNKVKERESRWYQPIRQSNVSWATIIKEWDFRVCLFLREDAVERAISIFNKDPNNFSDVSVISLDSILLPWEWNWDKGSNIPINLLR